jgi:hypothetical protein
MLVILTITTDGRYKYNKVAFGTDSYLAEAGALMELVYVPHFTT